MSQRHFTCGPWHVLTGWDRPLQYHFLVVERDGEVVWSNLQLENPGMTPEQVVQQIGALGLAMVMPKSLYKDLREDMIQNAGNHIHEYPPVGVGGLLAEMSESLALDDEPPTSDGPPYTNAVDDQDGMSEVRPFEDDDFDRYPFAGDLPQASREEQHEREIADHTGAMTTAHRGTSSVSPETPEP